MCTGIAVTLSELPAPLAEAHRERVCSREGRQELQFNWRHEPALLPVWWEGHIKLVRRGNKRRSSGLPYGGWVDRDQLAAGLLSHANPEAVVILANLGVNRGTWFLIEEGISGVLLPATPAGPIVYMITAPATNYYRNMTGQSSTMPVFVNQVI